MVGEHQKFASAIISPNIPYIHEWLESMNKDISKGDPLIENPDVLKAIQEEVKKLNAQLSEPERIHRFRLVGDEWSPATGELSPTLKLRRKFIAEKYSEQLDQIYSRVAE